VLNQIPIDSNARPMRFINNDKPCFKSLHTDKLHICSENLAIILSHHITQKHYEGKNSEELREYHKKLQLRSRVNGIEVKIRIIQEHIKDLEARLRELKARLWKLERRNYSVGKRFRVDKRLLKRRGNPTLWRFHQA